MSQREPSSIFASCCLFFVPMDGLSARATKLMKPRVLEMGGRVEDQLTVIFSGDLTQQEEDDNDVIDLEQDDERVMNPVVTHLIVARSVNSDSFLRYLGRHDISEAMIARLHVVTDGWVTDSIKKKQRLNEKDHQFPYHSVASSPALSRQATPTQSPPPPSPPLTPPDPPLPLALAASGGATVPRVPAVKMEASIPEVKMEVCSAHGGGGEEEEYHHTRPSMERNRRLAKMFKQLSSVYKAIATEPSQDFQRYRHYSRISEIVSTWPEPIESVQDLRPLRGCYGAKTDEKVNEFFRTGSSQRLAHLLSDERTKAFMEFQQIWHVGAAESNKLYRRGLRTLADVKRHPEYLSTDLQRRCLKYVEDFQKKMTRAEVEEAHQQVCSVAERLYPGELHIVLTGSYRRGDAQTKDIDFLITRHDDREVADEVNRIVDSLSHDGFMTDTLVLSPGCGFGAKSEHKSVTFYGVCRPRKGGPLRRIDMWMQHRSEYAFALLHCTGSAQFNITMRTHADKMGLQLTQHKLAKVIEATGSKQGARRSGQSRNLTHEGPPIPCETEEEIFTAMGLRYRPPPQRFHDRDFGAECHEAIAHRKLTWYWPDGGAVDSSGEPLAKRRKKDDIPRPPIVDQLLVRQQHQLQLKRERAMAAGNLKGAMMALKGA
ncbi:unnamed protein product [Vitrella brassicaformis CCMP3155]|uniref:DNA polymerase n=2 Tax=Vitrella brassicaformis TaxID=1169539 RepID=A0A0G4G4N2_VITBC|nr:unnamed protein product [Vitrella brassicaformis CCMP3155]|eukprot:CEM22951.1 unnamed protein product [Vitrella brassicaformis CCMP3155]